MPHTWKDARRRPARFLIESPVVRWTLRAALLAAACALVAAAPASAGNGGLGPVPPKSPNAEGISNTYWLILAITGAVFLIVETTLIVFLIRFRRRRRARSAEGPQIRGNTNLEIAWTVVPVLILVAIAGYVFSQLSGIQDVPAARAGDRLEIRVEGQQFYWEFRYPDGQVAVDTMVVPVGRVVRLTVVGNDLIHSWWIPALGGKIDAIPGRENHTWFRASKPGLYRGQCAELCGLQHAAMLGWVKVVSPAEYTRFLAVHEPSSPTVARETFDGVCAKCHGPQGEGDVGPPIAGSTFAKADTTQLLRQGGGAMPAVGAHWSTAQIDATIRYLNRTKGGAESGG
jgi:cytochrome c oxidase subunit 2